MDLNEFLNKIDFDKIPIVTREDKIKEAQEREGIDLTCYFKDKSYNECCAAINNLNNSIFDKNYFSQGDIEFLKEYKEYLALMNKNIKEGTIQFLNERKNDFGHDVEFKISNTSDEFNFENIRVRIKDIDESFLFWDYHINKELVLYENVYDEKLHDKKLEEVKKIVDVVSKPSYYTKESYLSTRDGELFGAYIFNYSNSDISCIKSLYNKAINTEINDNKKIVNEVNKYLMEKLLNYYGLNDLNVKYDDVKEKIKEVTFGESLRREIKSFAFKRYYNYSDEDYNPLNETVIKNHPFVQVKRKIIIR